MSLVPNLGADFCVFGIRAAASLRDHRRAGGEPQRPGIHDPRLREHDRVLDGHLVEHLVTLAGELLDDVHLIGVEQAASAEPGLVGEADGVEHQRVAFPPADRVPHVRVLKRTLRIVRTPVERDHAEVRVPAAAVDPASVEHRDVVVGVEYPRGRSVPRNSERKASHDRVVSVRPHVELLNLVPVLRLVQRVIRVEPRRRHEHEVRALVGPLHAALRLKRSAAPEHPARDASPTAARRLPRAGQVGLAVRQLWRLRRRRSESAAAELRLRRGDDETEEHTEDRNERRPNDLLFPHEPNSSRRIYRRPARHRSELHQFFAVFAVRTLSGTGTTTYTWPISVTTVFKSRTTTPLRRSTMVPAYSASILFSGLFQSW